MRSKYTLAFRRMFNCLFNSSTKKDHLLKMDVLSRSELVYVQYIIKDNFRGVYATCYCSNISYLILKYKKMIDLKRGYESHIKTTSGEVICKKSNVFNCLPIYIKTNTIDDLFNFYATLYLDKEINTI